MRTSSTTWILLAAVLVAGAYIGLVEQKAGSLEQRRQNARRAVRFDPARITSVRLVTDTMQAMLEREGNVWHLSAPVAARADGGEVRRILEALETLEQADIITGREQSQQGLSPADFGLDHPRLRITLGDGSRVWSLWAGKETPLRTHLFLQLEGMRNVFIVSTNLLSALPASMNALRDRRLFLGLPSNVARVDIKRPDGLLQLARLDGGGWRIQKPVGGRAAYAAVQELLDAIFAARAATFETDSAAASALYGLDEPAAQVTLVGGKPHVEQTLRIGRAVDGQPGRYYAMRAGSESIVTLEGPAVQALARPAEELRDRRVMALPAYEVGHIKIEEGERGIVLQREGDETWSLREPRQAPASAARVRALLAEWTGLRIESFINHPGVNLAAWGLAPPARTVTFSRQPPAEGVPSAAPADDQVTIQLAQGPYPDGLAVAKVSGEEALFRVQADALDLLAMDPLAYRDPVVLNLSPSEIRSLALLTANGTQWVERASSTNEFRAAPGFLVDSNAVAQTLAALARLEAAGFVAEDPSDLAPWGLQSPDAQLTIGLSGTGSIAKVICFARHEDTSNSVALIRGQGLVFLLDPATRARLLQPPALPTSLGETDLPSEKGPDHAGRVFEREPSF